MSESFTKLCEELEHHETDSWAAEAILKKEMLTRRVIDPCVGAGVLTEKLRESRYWVLAQDIHDWGAPDMDRVADWLGPDALPPHLKDKEFSVFMNAPFSLAHKFVARAFELGARKIINFHTMQWYTSAKRRAFWNNYPPNRIWVCGDRATCWRHDIPAADRVDAKGKPRTTPTTHAFYVWDRAAPAGTLIGHLWKSDAEAKAAA